jgi:hypothetical protein
MRLLASGAAISLLDLMLELRLFESCSWLILHSNIGDIYLCTPADLADKKIARNCVAYTQ